MKKKTCYLFVFDGFSECEVSYTSVGINLSEGFKMKTIAIEKTMKKSFGGLSVLPDQDFISHVDLDDIDSGNTGLVILPGGRAWEQKTNNQIDPLIRHCFENDIPIAAIGGSTIFLADRCWLNEREHTSNDVSYLHDLSSSYLGHDFYIDRPSVRSKNLITANGVAEIAFAKDIFEVLDISEEDSVKSWFQYFDRVVA